MQPLSTLHCCLSTSHSQFFLPSFSTHVSHGFPHASGKQLFEWHDLYNLSLVFEIELCSGFILEVAISLTLSCQKTFGENSIHSINAPIPKYTVQGVDTLAGGVHSGLYDANFRRFSMRRYQYIKHKTKDEFHHLCCVLYIVCLVPFTCNHLFDILTLYLTSYII